MPPADERDHDVVLYGASGFVGRLTAAYLAAHAPGDVRIALAGRSLPRLERAREELGAAAAAWPLLVADSQDDAALGRLAASATVVATTVGPYAHHGLPLVRACAAAGTHYADLAGETLFMRRSIDAADGPARASGARIVHTCGFDSIPSDLGVLLLHQHAEASGLGPLGDTTLVVRSIRGGPSGGTIDSMRALLDEARSDPASRRLLMDPYALSPDRASEPDLGGERDPLGVSYDAQLGGWLAPFVMGMVNSRVVRRSNALQGHAYGRELRYRELMLAGGLPLGPIKASAIAGTFAGIAVGLTLPPTRVLLDRVLPEPGEGPSAAARDRGHFRIQVHTRTASGAQPVCHIEASGDPGYKATSVMLGESALALARDGARLPDAAGVLTPATAMGNVLVDRLRAAGHRYEVAAAGA